VNDFQRMAVLAGIDIDNPELRGKLDAVAARTAERVGREVGLISMVLDSSQFFAGASGLDGWLAELGGTPIEWSFCVHAVRSRQPYVVPDARIDALQSANPLVHVEGVRSYAGVPIVVDGEVLGAHCVLGYAAGDFSPADVEELRRGAEEIVALLTAYRRPATAP
jgi:GAF domain-containing protein